ncbi:MAG: metallophosphoesterase [Spirulinaceae cyanobacterium]
MINDKCLIMNFRFAIISDLHIGLPETIWDSPKRFHLIEVSIPALEKALTHLEALNLDFLLLPGDLTQHGEPENHSWLQKRLASLPFPAYVIPGNHDVPSLNATDKCIGLKDFPSYYQDFGYDNPEQLYYTKEIHPGVQLIALNSNQFDASGQQLGCIDQPQLLWLEKVLSQYQNKFIMVMVHHNVVEHLPGQSLHPLGQRYMLDNAPQLKKLLRRHGVQLIFTGHLHVQDIAQEEELYEITTGSLVSYPHPYRILELNTNKLGEKELNITSHQVKSVPGWENLPQFSREWMGDRSYPFMMRLLTDPPLKLPVIEAEKYIANLRYFWADIAQGDSIFDFPTFPEEISNYFRGFSAINKEGKPALIDNNTVLKI